MLAGAEGCAPPPPPPGCRLAAIIWFILVSNSGAVSQQGHGHTYICCMFGSDSIVVAMFIRAGLFRNAPRSGMPGNSHHKVMRLMDEVARSGLTSRSPHARHTGHPREAREARVGGTHARADLVLRDLEVGLVALVVWLQLQRLLEVVHGLLVLVEAAVGEPHPAVRLAVAGVHVDGPLAVLDGEVMVVHLAVGRRAVAVEHGVGAVQLDRLGVHVQSLLELLCPHQIIALGFQPLGLLLVRCRGRTLLTQLKQIKL